MLSTATAGTAIYRNERHRACWRDPHDIVIYGCEDGRRDGWNNVSFSFYRGFDFRQDMEAI